MKPEDVARAYVNEDPPGYKLDTIPPKGILVRFCLVSLYVLSW